MVLFVKIVRDLVNPRFGKIFLSKLNEEINMRGDDIKKDIGVKSFNALKEMSSKIEGAYKTNKVVKKQASFKGSPEVRDAFSFYNNHKNEYSDSQMKTVLGDKMYIETEEEYSNYHFSKESLGRRGLKVFKKINERGIHDPDPFFNFLGRNYNSRSCLIKLKRRLKSSQSVYRDGDNVKAVAGNLAGASSNLAGEALYGGIGSFIGSAVCPVVGTAIGGAIGGYFGHKASANLIKGCNDVVCSDSDCDNDGTDGDKERHKEDDPFLYDLASLCW